LAALLFAEGGHSLLCSSEVGGTRGYEPAGQLTCGFVGGLESPVLKHGPRSLTRARVKGWQTRLRNESERCDPGVYAPGATPAGLVIAIRPELKRIGQDPKDCELCLFRMKPGESLVEVRSDADVQIARQK